MITTTVPMDLADLVFNSLTESLLLVDTDLRALMGNRAFYETMGVAPGTLAGTPLDEIIVDAPRLRNMLEAVCANKCKLKELEIVCDTPAGANRVLLVSARRVSQKSDPTEMLLLEFRDITSAKAIAQKVVEANRALDRHTAELELSNRELESYSHTISHDLRSPLRFVSRIAHLLLDEHGKDLPPNAVELVNLIVTSAEEMARLIDHLLHFAQISREPMKKRRVSIERLVRDAIDELEEERRACGAEITTDALAPCEGDSALLKQLILNLLENALKYTSESESPKIHIGCNQTGDQCVYFVRDNGVGFDPSESESMFLVFRRLARTKKVAGSGVGLAIAKRVVERHGGRIWADGAPGGGATFYFTIGENLDSHPNSNEGT